MDPFYVNSNTMTPVVTFEVQCERAVFDIMRTIQGFGHDRTPLTIMLTLRVIKEIQGGQFAQRISEMGHVSPQDLQKLGTDEYIVRIIDCALSKNTTWPPQGATEGNACPIVFSIGPRTDVAV